MLEKFIKIYTWVATIIILLVTAYALVQWWLGETEQAGFFGFCAFMLLFILLITLWFVKKNLRKS